MLRVVGEKKYMYFIVATATVSGPIQHTTLLDAEAFPNSAYPAGIADCTH